jgi:hypothetical protein
MSFTHRWKKATGLTTALAGAVIVGGILSSPRLAFGLDRQTEERIAAGYSITQAPVDLHGKDPLQVGIGSYIVNGTGVCNHCHSVDQYHKAQYPQTTAAQTGNPYYLPPPFGPYSGGILNGRATFLIDHTTFLAGGQDFGAVRSKNLTPSPNGNVATPTDSTPYYAGGGIDWITYWGVLHNGVDIDQLLTQCSSGTTGPAGCVDAPSNAYVLQVMPWPAIRLLTDSDLNAVWQYLSAVPCTTNLSNVNGPSGSNIANTYGGGVLVNGCTAAIPEDRYKFYQYANGKVVQRASP